MDLHGVFDPQVLDSVARETGLPAGPVRELVEKHQRSVRTMTGVEPLVYDLRQYHDPDPLCERTEAAYYLLVPTDFWQQVAAHLSLTGDERRALEGVHERQFRQAVEDGGTGEAVVLLRE